MLVEPVPLILVCSLLEGMRQTVIVQVTSSLRTPKRDSLGFKLVFQHRLPLDPILRPFLTYT